MGARLNPLSTQSPGWDTTPLSGYAPAQGALQHADAATVQPGERVAAGSVPVAAASDLGF
jgi:hypothetical protein